MNASPPNGEVGRLSDRLRAAVNVVKTTTKLTPKGRGDRNNIKVGVRCRPLSNYELELEQESIVEFTDTEICITNPAPQAGEPPNHVFAYDHVYSPDGTSEQVYEDMGRPLVEGLFNGFNGTIFAYGQTGSGKTHSMMGNEGNPGVVPRVCQDIFSRCEALPAGAPLTFDYTLHEYVMHGDGFVCEETGRQVRGFRFLERAEQEAALPRAMRHIRSQHSQFLFGQESRC